MRSGRTGNLSTTGVMAAIENSITSRGQVLELIKKLAEDVVSRGEFTSVVEALTGQIAELQERLQALAPLVGEPAAAEPVRRGRPRKNEAEAPKNEAEG